MNFRDNLKDELFFQNIQLKEFSGKLKIPYSTFLSYIDSRNRLPKVDVAYKIAEQLNVTVEYLITGKPEDNYKKNLTNTNKELLVLPSCFINQIQNIIHSYYELYKLTNNMR
ncbi:MAG: helix-turn-helix transcriptional regulator [Treponema sp.]|nr:helix-turn-helix transcriptional regulator [Treponema sp.]